MVAGIWGKKIGMTQVFDENVVVPVTAISLDSWVVVGSKTVQRDGYDALKVGCIKDRYVDEKFMNDWVKKPKKYFSFIREIKLEVAMPSLVVGSKLDFLADLVVGAKVDAMGITKGCGFAGVVKRHGFVGAKASHGATMGKAPGSMSGARSKGKVIKGKRLPGHMGVKQQVMKGLKIIRKVESPNSVVLIKGSIPGKGGSLVYLRKVS